MDVSHVFHQKKSGTLRLERDRITWQGDGTASVCLFISKIKGTPKQSPAGGSRSMIMFEAVDSNAKTVFDFRNAKGAADFTSRARAMKHLQGLMAAKRAPPAPSQVVPAPPAQKASAAPPLAASEPKTPRAPSKAVSGAEKMRRAKIVAEHPEIGALYTKLKGHCSDDHFFDAIAHRLKRARPAASVGSGSLGKGVPNALESSLEDGASGTGNTRSYTLTKEVITQIFLAHPEVHRAYKAEVPDNMDINKFFRTFFESSLHNRERRRMGMGSDADELFAKYELEEQKVRGQELRNKTRNIDLKLNLNRMDPHRSVHVEDTHAEDSAVAARARQKTPFADTARRLNRHGTLVIDSNDGPSSWLENDEDKRFADIDMQAEEALELSKIAIKNGSVFFGTSESKSSEAYVVPDSLREAMRSWQPDLGRAAEPCPSAIEVLTEIGFQKKVSH